MRVGLPTGHRRSQGAQREHFAQGRQWPQHTEHEQRTQKHEPYDDAPELRSCDARSGRRAPTARPGARECDSCRGDAPKGGAETADRLVTCCCGVAFSACSCRRCGRECVPGWWCWKGRGSEGDCVPGPHLLHAGMIVRLKPCIAFRRVGDRPSLPRRADAAPKRPFGAAVRAWPRRRWRPCSAVSSGEAPSFGSCSVLLAVGIGLSAREALRPRNPVVPVGQYGRWTGTVDIAQTSNPARGRAHVRPVRPQSDLRGCRARVGRRGGDHRPARRHGAWPPTAAGQDVEDAA